MPDPAPHFPPPPEMGTTHSAEYSSQQLYETIIHLRGLGIGYYVLAGFCTLGCLCGTAYSGFILFALATLPNISETQGDNEAKVALGFAVFALFIILIFVMLMVATILLFFYTGRFLREQRRYTVCLFGSILSCLNFPLGTLLGVFTIILLNRDGVKELFAQNDLRAAEISQKEKANAG